MDHKFGGPLEEGSQEEKFDASKTTEKQHLAEFSIPHQDRDKHDPIPGTAVAEKADDFLVHQDDRLEPIIEWPYPDDAVYPTHLTVHYPDPEEPDGMPDPEDSDEEVEEKATGDPVMSGKERRRKRKREEEEEVSPLCQGL